MKKLVVYWKKYSIPAAEDQVSRKYKVQPMRTDFDVDVDPCKAVDEILEKHGSRPIASSPFQIVASAHSFAVVTDWRVLEIQNRPVEAMVPFIQVETFSPEEMSHGNH